MLGGGEEKEEKGRGGLMPVDVDVSGKYGEGGEVLGGVVVQRGGWVGLAGCRNAWRSSLDVDALALISRFRQKQDLYNTYVQYAYVLHISSHDVAFTF